MKNQSILASIRKDPSDNYEDGLLELYKKIRPGEPLSVDSAESLINRHGSSIQEDMILRKVGRYKFNKKLALRNRNQWIYLSRRCFRS